MNKRTLFFIILFIISVWAFLFYASKTSTIYTANPSPITKNKIKPIESSSSTPPKTTEPISLKSKEIKNVPFISEAPDNNWVSPWKNACEEASIAMVYAYYNNKTNITIAEQKDFMQILFDMQDKLYGSNANSDAKRSNYLINNYSSFTGRVVNNPTIEQIKKEIDNNHPVITFHYGFDLKNPNIPFLASGTSYHSTVVVGYDDSKKAFIVNDSGDDIDGKNHLYGYSLYMHSLHDYNFQTNKADGPARVIFTSK